MERPQVKPVKPLTAYFAFIHDHSEEHRNLASRERTKTLAQMWKDLDETTRKTYTDAYDERIRAYKAAMEIWLEDHPEDKNTPSKDKGKKKDADVRERRGAEDIGSQQPGKPYLSADVSTNVKIFFCLGYIIKYAEKNGGKTLPNDKKVRTLLASRYDKLSDKERAAWADAWTDLDEEKRLEMVTFYNECLSSNVDAA